jgi:hypothetical protein
MKKRLVLLFWLPLLWSACGDDDRIMILEAEIDGVENTAETANATRSSDIIGGESVRYYYWITGSGPSITIEAYDSSFSKRNFSFPEFSATYIEGTGNDSLRHCDAVDGQFTISEVGDGLITGTFSFNAVNQSDATDTVHIRNGYYQITLDEYERSFK